MSGRVIRAVRRGLAAGWRRIVRRFTHRRIGGRLPKTIVVHASLPPGVITSIGAALAARAPTLPDAGIGLVTPVELRDLGRTGWSAAWATTDTPKFSAALRKRIAAIAVRRPQRALILTAGRILGQSPLSMGEATDLRPRAEQTVGELVSAIGAAVTLVLDLPSARDLVDILLAGAVEAGDPLPSVAPEVAPDLYERLAERLGRLPGIERVIVLHGENADPAGFAAVLDGLGLKVDLPESAGAGYWNLRSVQAALAITPHVDPTERDDVLPRVRAELGSAPSRPVRALIEPPAAYALHVAAPSRIKVLHLHIGLQKTATTTVQTAFHTARDAFAERGVAYVGRRFMMRLPDRGAWRAYPHSGPAHFDEFATQLRRTVAKHRRRAARRSGKDADIVLISNESSVGAMEKGPYLERPFRPRAEGAISDLLDILQPDECHLILVTRRQDSLLESQYMWQIHGGEWFDFDRYAAQAATHPEALSYTDLGTRLEAIVGVNRLTVRPFETIRNGLDTFLATILASLGITFDFTETVFDRERNPAYSEAALVVAKSVNPHLTDRKERRWMRDFLRDTFPVRKQGRAQLLDDQARAEIISMFAADNRRFFERWMPDLPADAYATPMTAEMIGGSDEGSEPVTSRTRTSPGNSPPASG